jgi:hypothetical protein
MLIELWDPILRGHGRVDSTAAARGIGISKDTLLLVHTSAAPMDGPDRCTQPQRHTHTNTHGVAMCPASLPLQICHCLVYSIAVPSFTLMPLILSGQS